MQYQTNCVKGCVNCFQFVCVLPRVSFFDAIGRAFPFGSLGGIWQVPADWLLLLLFTGDTKWRFCCFISSGATFCSLWFPFDIMSSSSNLDFWCFGPECIECLLLACRVLMKSVMTLEGFLFEYFKFCSLLDFEVDQGPPFFHFCETFSKSEIFATSFSSYNYLVFSGAPT